MTVVDHPLRQIAELNFRISAEVSSWSCWKADLLWGAYLTLEFGSRQILIGKTAPLAIGQFRVLLDEAAWWVQRDGKYLLDCDDVLEGPNKPALDEAFLGRRLLRLEWREQMSAIFSDGIALIFERPEDTHEQLLELRFANGDCIDVYANGAIETESTSS